MRSPLRPRASRRSSAGAGRRPRCALLHGQQGHAAALRRRSRRRRRRAARVRAARAAVCGHVIGTGRQWLSWIHIDDLLDVLLFALDQETLRAAERDGAGSRAARELMAAIAATLKRPLWPLRIPASCCARARRARRAVRRRAARDAGPLAGAGFHVSLRDDRRGARASARAAGGRRNARQRLAVSLRRRRQRDRVAAAFEARCQRAQIFARPLAAPRVPCADCRPSRRQSPHPPQHRRAHPRPSS